MPGVHVIFLPCKSAGLRLPPSYCFVLDYSLINQTLSFLPPTLFMWVFACVSLLHRLEFLLSWSVPHQLHWLLHSPPSQPLATTLLADITLLWLFTSHTLPYINSALGQHALLYIVGKLFKKIQLARILIEVTKHGLIWDKQFRFQPKHSMSLSLAYLTEKITRNYGEKRLTGAVFLHVAKAFNTVWIDGLRNLLTYLVKTTSKNHTSGVRRSKCPSRWPHHLIVACGLGWHMVVSFPLSFSVCMSTTCLHPPTTSSWLNRPRDFYLIFAQVFSLIYRSSAAVMLWHLQTNNSK
jgi:hypothetical protein